MSSKNNRPSLHIFIAIPVILIVLGAFALSVAAVAENLRFAKATNQVIDLIGSVREVISGQKTFAQTPGEDIWADLERVGRAPVIAHTNPWQGNVRATAVANVAMRIESDLPVHDCRRMALYFLEQSMGLGLVAIEAQTVGSDTWYPIYPAPDSAHGHAAEIACDTASNARLALVFKIR